MIPDYYGDSRVVQIDDMSGAGWTEMQAADIGWSTDSYMLPYDIDFDGTGRIYVANFTSSGGRLGIFRINNISGDNPTEITNTVERAKCIAIDRLRNIIYYASAPEGEYLYRCNLDGSEHKQLIASEIFTFNGLAVDEEGMLYIAGDGDFGDVLYKYDPVTETIEEQYGRGNENIGEAWDVLVKDELVYMANYNGFDEYQIMRFDKNLQLLDNFGINAAAHDRLASPLEKDFLGPHRFVAILNKKITIIDENGGSADTERLVSFEDMEGTGWDTFEPNGTTQSAFEFFEQY